MPEFCIRKVPRIRCCCLRMLFECVYQDGADAVVAREDVDGRAVVVAGHVDVVVGHGRTPASCAALAAVRPPATSPPGSNHP